MSRLTWFTRFDPVKPKEQASSAEQSVESINGQAHHHTTGGSSSASLQTVAPVEYSSYVQTISFSFNSADSSVSSVRTQSRFMSVLCWLCGMEQKREDNPPPAPEPTVCTLEEKPCLRVVVNINLIVCLSVTAFIIGYWA